MVAPPKAGGDDENQQPKHDNRKNPILD